MKILAMPQLSQEWYEARRGIPTASRFDRIITAKKAEYAAASWGYMCELLAERFHQGELPSFGPSPATPSMMHGIECEPEARAWYALTCGEEVRQVGFCLTDDGRFGCSPDGLVGRRGVLELKCPDLKTHISYLLNSDLLVTDYRAQSHGHLRVGEGEWDWCDLVSYYPGWPSVKRRLIPDEFTDALQKCLDRFLRELDAAAELIQSIRMREAA